MGFDSEQEYRRFLYGRKGIAYRIELLLQGKTSDITEQMAERFVESAYYKFIFKRYTNYDQSWIVKEPPVKRCKTAKESLLSACNKPYCVIYKPGNRL